MCFVGLLGIVLMIINNEITFSTGSDQDTLVNWFIKLTISISTVILIGLVFYYHKLDLTLFSLKNSIEDWRIGLTIEKLFLIIFEILVCSIHPVPRQFQLNKNSNSTITPTDPVGFSYISIDIALSLPSKYKNLFILFKIKQKLYLNSVCSFVSNLSFYGISFPFNA